MGEQIPVHCTWCRNIKGAPIRVLWVLDGPGVRVQDVREQDAKPGDACGKCPGCGCYTGEESTAQKEFSRKQFVDGDARLLVMSLRAGAGLDGLQGVCRTVVFGELDWSPGVHEQCIGRVHRDGQPDPVAAYFLIADSGSDPVVADVLGIKRQQSEALRDPDAPLVEALQIEEGHIKKLAAAYLAQQSNEAVAA